MTPLRALLLGAIAYAVFLLATLPAAVVAPWVASLSNGQASVSGASGTVWKGSGRVRVSAPGMSFALDEVRWTFWPSRLLAGRAAVSVEAQAGALKAVAEVARSPFAWRIDDLHAQGDASALPTLFPLASAWHPSGTMVAEAAHLTWDGRNATGSASAEWREAALALSAVRPLGSWRATAQGDGRSLKIDLATLAGPLRLAGKGTLALPGRLAFSGEARAEPGRESELKPLLDLIGPRRADGAHALEAR